MAVWILIAFQGYLRPSECMRLRRRDLIRPVPGLSRHWGLIINAVESGVRSKIGTVDDSIMLDSEDFQWCNQIWEVLKEGPPEESLWRFSYSALTWKLRDVCRHLQIELTPYQLRHAGPSDDRIRGRRSLMEIQKRGRWLSYRSVARYEQASWLLAQTERMSTITRQRAEAAERHLEGVVLLKVAPDFLTDYSKSSREAKASQELGGVAAAKRRRLT
mgnify:CR=1 FL=1